jgi:transcriptional regulator with XRE-family HTH domain
VIERATGEIVFRSSEQTDAYEILAELLESAPRPEGIFASSRDVGLCRRKIRELGAAGVSLRQVARVSGVARSRLQELMRGYARRRDRPRRRRMKLDTCERILFVPLDAFASHALVPAEGTWGLLRCLLRAGWRRIAIARALAEQAGWRGGSSPRSLQIRGERVFGRTARAVASIHDKAWRLDHRVRTACECSR